MKKMTREPVWMMPSNSIKGLMHRGEVISERQAIGILSRQIEALTTALQNLSGIAQCRECKQFRPTDRMLILPNEWNCERICADNCECPANFLSHEEGDNDTLLATILVERSCKMPSGTVSGCFRESHRLHSLWLVFSQELEGFDEIAAEGFKHLP